MKTSRATLPYFRRPLLIALLLVAVLLAVGLWRASGPVGRPEWEHAQRALENDDLPAARERLQAFHALQPESGAGCFLLARTLRRLGDYSAAERSLEKAQQLGWNRRQIREESALALLQRDAPAKSRDELLKIAEEGGLQTRLLFEALYRGDMAAKIWNRAGLWLHLWLTQHPDDWTPRLWQAELLEQMQNHDRALADFKLVLKLRPDHPRALRGAGLIALNRRAEYGQAEEYLGRYLAIVPDDRDAMLGIARCHYGRGHLDLAKKTTAAVLAADPHHAAAALLLGTLELEMGNGDEALRWLRHAEQQKADAMAVSYALAQAYRQSGRDAEADQYHDEFTRLREIHRTIEALEMRELPFAPTADKWHQLGKLALQLGDSDRAADCFWKGLQLDRLHRGCNAALAEYFAQQPGELAAAKAEQHRRLASAAN